MNLSDASDGDEEEEEDDEELDAVGREAAEEGVESPFFGGDGVRGLTSTTLRLSVDNDDDITEVDAFLDASAGAAEVEELVERPSPRGVLKGGDADLERGATSTTFNSVEAELVAAAVTPAEEDILLCVIAKLHQCVTQMNQLRISTPLSLHRCNRGDLYTTSV